MTSSPAVTLSSSSAEGVFYRLSFEVDDITAAQAHADVERAVALWVRRLLSFTCVASIEQHTQKRNKATDFSEKEKMTEGYEKKTSTVNKCFINFKEIKINVVTVYGNRLDDRVIFFSDS